MKHKLLLTTTLAITAALALSGCTNDGEATDTYSIATESAAGQSSTGEEVTEQSSAGVDSAAIRNFDFGEATWTLGHTGLSAMPGEHKLGTGASPETSSSNLSILEEALLYNDVNGDGLEDALVPLVQSAIGGETTEWFIWLGREDGSAQQVLEPVAIHGGCRGIVEDVRTVPGGFEIEESLIAPGTSNTNWCERSAGQPTSRVVVVTDEGPESQPWPVQQEPIQAFGGVCPLPAGYEAIPLDATQQNSANNVNYQLSPDVNSPLLTKAEAVTWHVEEKLSATDLYPGWDLVGYGVRHSDPMLPYEIHYGCAWIQASPSASEAQ